MMMMMTIAFLMVMVKMMLMMTMAFLMVMMMII